ncbi:hypothetical protein HPP_3820 [Hydrangea phyllody phytoplasma]|uniref:DUF2963 domain-containing protein n=2 Tax=16SrI (Aster yellows group) TaxID=3042590 RepID=A0ABQ5PSI4_9MOLU|nr:DUF2963 domain-containing protein [Hydrangea phyllody phytoplasma]GFZ75424.1 hypothetical protein HPP_3820 [Hydrangea phyllody phytoplasma]GLH61338.1 hypothetical protein RHYP_2840 [Rhus yellows phytoplasma]GLH61801.1 hypothetical protein HP2P_2080 [Hydrangea phyllody phytoplasma]
MFWIASHTYKYHLETEKRRTLLETDILEEAKKLNEKIHQENVKLKKEIDKLTLPDSFKQIGYYPDGKTIKLISWYNPKTGNKTKETNCNSDGKISYITEYDPQTGKEIKRTEYNSDGTISSINDLIPQKH